MTTNILNKRHSRVFLLMLSTIIYLVMVFAGCSGDEDSNPSSSNGNTTPPDTVKYGDVSPVFAANCSAANCHGGSSPQLGLNLTSYNNILSGSNNGPVVVSGNSTASELYKRVTGVSTPQMPFNASPLSTTDQDLIKNWIDDGLLQ